MFTGIVQTVGTVAVIEETPSGVSLFIDPFPSDTVPPEWARSFEDGESICVGGCCLTLARTIAKHGRGHHSGAGTAGTTPGGTAGSLGNETGGAGSGLHTTSTSTTQFILGFDVIPESLVRTTLGNLRPGAHVNLERSATLQTFLGGNIVQGHVDGLGVVTRVQQDDQWRVRVQPADQVIMQYVIPKGSIAIDGVSLTVASLTKEYFEVALIPTTLERTTLGTLKVGDQVNLEADSIAKTVVHWLRHFGAASAASLLSAPTPSPIIKDVRP